MRRLLGVLFAVGALAGCPREEAPAPRQASPRALAAPEAAPGGETVEEPEKPYALTQEKLDAFVEYQRKVVGGHAAMMKSLQQTKSRAGTPAGHKSQDEAALLESMRLIEGKAEAETEARQAAKLTEEDVNRISALVMDVLSQRQVSLLEDLRAELEQLEAMQAKLPPAQQKELAPQLAELRKQVERLERLEQARRVHGAANVDLVLTREQELRKNHEAMLEALGARTQ